MGQRDTQKFWLGKSPGRGSALPCAVFFYQSKSGIIRPTVIPLDPPFAHPHPRSISQSVGAPAPVASSYKKARPPRRLHFFPFPTTNFIHDTARLIHHTSPISTSLTRQSISFHPTTFQKPPKCPPRPPLTRSPPLPRPPPPRPPLRRRTPARRPPPLATRRSGPRPARRPTLHTSTRVSFFWRIQNFGLHFGFAFV